MISFDSRTPSSSISVLSLVPPLIADDFCTAVLESVCHRKLESEMRSGHEEALHDH